MHGTGLSKETLIITYWETKKRDRSELVKSLMQGSCEKTVRRNTSKGRHAIPQAMGDDGDDPKNAYPRGWVSPASVTHWRPIGGIEGWEKVS